MLNLFSQDPIQYPIEKAFYFHFFIYFNNNSRNNNFYYRLYGDKCNESNRSWKKDKNGDDN